MVNALTIIIVLASILMVGIVLIQKSKGGGLAENFAKGNNFASVKQTTDIVEKITWGLMAFIAVLCIISSVMQKDEMGTVKHSEVTAPAPQTQLPMNNQGQQPAQPAQQAPAQ